MELKTYFTDFLQDIRLTTDQVKDLKNEHEKLRDLLKNDEKLSDIIVDTFLQGSYRRSTIIKPKDENDKPDVDVVVATTLDKSCSPKKVLEKFEPFLKKNYNDKYEIQRRSLGISLDTVDLDLVVTAVPSGSEKNIVDILEKSGISSNLSIEDIEKEMINSSSGNMFKSAQKIKTFFEIKKSAKWKDEPLYIPDYEANVWDETDPLEQIRWTFEKNDKTNGHYVNVVKALKWWRKEKYPEAKHPKSYPLEHFIGDCCPDDIESVAEGVTRTLKEIVDNHKTKPYLKDRGVPDHDVFGKLSYAEYEKFYSQVCEAAEISKEALNSDDKKESITKWRELFGEEFPPYKENKNIKSGGFKRTEKTSNLPGGKFA